MTRVLITGVSGQDGSELAEQCLLAGEQVYGLIRWTSRHQGPDLLARIPELRLIDGDLTDAESLKRALRIAKPDVVYNLGALASSGQSWAQPMMMGEINALGPLKMLEAIQQIDPSIRFVQASTSEQYGRVNEQPQSERTPFGSLNIYGVAKTFAHQATINYRDSYDLHASTALMHNHVSLRRNAYFVDQKIVQGAVDIYRGDAETLVLGNLEARRDWGWGPEYMAAWRLIAAADEPGDYVLATGESHSVQGFVEAVFERLGLDWPAYVIQDPAFMRPTDVIELRGDASYIEKTLGWRAEIRFEEIVRRMVDHELAKRR